MRATPLPTPSNTLAQHRTIPQLVLASEDIFPRGGRVRRNVRALHAPFEPAHDYRWLVGSAFRFTRSSPYGVLTLPESPIAQKRRAGCSRAR